MIVSRKEAEKKLGKELCGPQYVGKRWFLLSRSVPHRNLGGFATKQEAKDHERAVQYFKRNPRETPVPPGVRDRQLWLRQRAKVKKRVGVWPSAYASGQVVQEYKRAGGRFYNPGRPLDDEALLELELAVIENPKPRKNDWDIDDRRGTVGLTFNWFDWAPEYPLIRDLEVKEKRKGHGSSLVKAAISEARKRGTKGIILPPPESAESRKFWKSQDGWKPLRKKGYRGWMVYRFTEKNPLTGLDKWFAEEWVDMARSVYLSGPKAGQLKPGGWVKCGRPDTTKGGYPKCRPLAEAKRMTPEQRLYAIRKKRKAERKASKKPGRAPIMVKTYKKKSNPDSNPERKKLYIYPNKSAVKVAKRALERRKKLPKSKRGGLDAMDAHEQGIGSGVLRARDIAAGKRINAYQVKAFFDRHRHNFVKAKADGKKWEDSKAWQAWDLWGGEPLRKQVEKAVEKDKKMRKSNPPKTMPPARVIEFLSFESYDLYKNVGYTDSFGRHTPIPDDMLEDFERADKMLQRASQIDPMYDDRYILIKKADAILRPMRDKVFEMHRDRFYKKRPFPRDLKRPNPYRKERFEHEGVPAGLKESKYESWGDWEARQGMYTGPIPPDPIAERKRRAEIKAKAQAKLRMLKGESDLVDNPRHRMTHKDLMNLLDSLGFVKIRQKGSHEIYLSPTGQTISIPRKKKSSEIMSPHYQKQIYAAVSNPDGFELGHALVLMNIVDTKSECMSSVLKSQLRYYEDLGRSGLIEISRIDGPHLSSIAEPGERLMLYTVCAKATKAGREFAQKSEVMRDIRREVMPMLHMVRKTEKKKISNPTRPVKEISKPPLAKDLIAECRALWESYCERPGRMRLRKVERHCDVMKASKFKTVKDERRRCMNAVRREKKKLGM